MREYLVRKFPNHHFKRRDPLLPLVAALMICGFLQIIGGILLLIAH